MKLLAPCAALLTILCSHTALAATYDETVAKNPKCRAIVAGEYTPTEAGFVCDITRPNGKLVTEKLISTCAPSPTCTEENSIAHARESCAAYFNVIILNDPNSVCYHQTGPHS